ncbi:MAG: hypothetical protein E6R07_02040 [Nevskiaceae bacterium]|nr:MAG: hypothetical protein E6R07_02040 [Nevskiaceae bacterium]
MSQLDVLAETVKLARFLGTTADALGYLRALDARQLRTLREVLSAAEFARSRPMFTRVTQASRLLPNALVALIGEKVFGAVLCARIAGLMPADRAVDLAAKMPDAFLADVAVELDPASAREVIAAMPAHRVVAIALILVQRGDFITMGRFVGYLRDTVIAAAITAITSDEALLRTAFFIESKDKLNALIGLLPEARLRSSIRLAADDRHGLWTEALSLMDHASREWKGRIGDLAAAEDASVLGGMLEAAQRLQVWDAVLPIVSCMSEANQRKVASLPGLASAEVLRSIIDAAERHGLWAELLPLVGHMHEGARRTAAQVVEHLPRTVLLKLLSVANQRALWPDLVSILQLMDDDERRNVVRLIGEQDESVLKALLEAMDRARLWGEVLPLLRDMGESARRTAARLLPHFPQPVLLRLIDTTDRLGLWPDLLAIASDMGEPELDTVATLIAQQDRAVLDHLIASTEAQNLWPQLLPIVSRLGDDTLKRAADTLRARLPALEVQARKLGVWDRLTALLPDITRPA